jgi:hypothetical protein
MIIINNKNDLFKYIGNEKFHLRDIRGPKPTSKEYKENKGTWLVTGFWKSR